MKAALIFILLFLFRPTSFCQVMPVALAGKTITSLTVAKNSYENLVIAGTVNDGLYFHDFAGEDSSWTQVSFVKRSLSCVYAQSLSPSLTKLFMALQPDSSEDSTLIYSNVLPVQSAIPPDDFGLDRNEIKVVKSLAGFDYPKPVFCCTNNPNIYVYKDSMWSECWKGPETTELNFVYTNDSTVWAGGFNNSAIGSAVLIKSTNLGESWEYINLPIGEVYSCFSMCVLPGNSSIIFVGLNENILKSTDGGNTWKVSLSNIKDVTFKCIAANPLKYGEVFAGGQANDNSFVLYKSIDGGNNWMPVVYYCNCIVKGINTLAGIIKNDEFILFIGTNGDGIWKYPAEVSKVRNEDVINSEYYLYQNFPNPFNPETKISFEIPVGGKVSLKVYDLIGREVAVLLNDKYKSAGFYSVIWDSKNNHGKPVPSGIYICRLVCGEQTRIIKMTLTR